MQTSLRLAARAASLRRCTTSSTSTLSRGLATAAPTHSEVHVASSASAATATSRKVTPIALANVEAQWTKLSEDEQAAVHEQLENVQVKDWRELSVDEKKAGE